MTPEQEQHVWRRARDRGDQEAANMLAIRYLPLARRAASVMAARAPVEFDLLFSGALYGLHQALSRFDPDRGAKFTTYALPIMFGRMRDELRALDTVPHCRRRAGRRAERAAEQIAHQLGRLPTDEDLEAAGIGHVDVPTTESLDAPSRNGYRIADGLEAKQIDTAAASVKRFREIRGLTNRERYILVAVFVLRLKQREIARRLGVSKGLVNLIFRDVLTRLRARGDRVREELTS